MTGRDSFVFLNKPGRVEDAKDWNDSKQGKLWIYNLHYFDDLNARDADVRLEWHRALINRWIADNPPTAGNGWEPYPVSLRVVNWIKWDLRVDALDEAAIASLALQLRWLRRRLEYHILGNHLLANAKALIFGGLFFEGSEADKWLSTGRRIFERELEEQVLSDGGHFELSPMYHLIVLEDLLDVINITRAYDRPVPKSWPETASRMLAWADVMRHPDGEIPFFNDAAIGIAGSLDELKDYAGRVLVDLPETRSGSEFLPESGYIRLEDEDAVVLLDTARIGPDYLPAHGHADTLSLELSLFRQRVFVNSGTSVYGDGPERERQRGTGAHNTLMINGRDSSEVWGGFRVARRAVPQVLQCSISDGIVVAEHDGYRRLPGRPIHRRRVELTHGSLLVSDELVTDLIEVAGGPSILVHVQGAWHLHPDIEVISEEVIRTGKETRAELKLRIPTQEGVKEAILVIQGVQTVALENCTWHPEFGLSLPTRRLTFTHTGRLPFRATTKLNWSHRVTN